MGRWREPGGRRAFLPLRFAPSLRVLLVLALAVLVGGGLGSRSGPLPAPVPSTREGIHIGLVFDSEIEDRSVERAVDIIWGASKPDGPGPSYRVFYATFDRDHLRPLRWWLAHHPEMVEYTCDRRTPAYEYGQTDEVPLDIANPAVRNMQWREDLAPALAHGYAGLGVDNLELDNPYRRCGHFRGDGRWVPQYSAASNARYRADAIAWTTEMRRRVHDLFPGRSLGINFHYDMSSSFRDNLALMLAADIVYDEGGFTNFGLSQRHVTTTAEWRLIVTAIRAVQAAGRCYDENAEEPQRSEAIPQAERVWAIANYLLTKDRCTWVQINGQTLTGAQDYGRLLLYPEYRIPIGTPTGSMIHAHSVYKRTFSHGLAIVNPTEHRTTVTLPPGSWRTYSGRPVGRALPIGPTSGTILLNHS